MQGYNMACHHTRRKLYRQWIFPQAWPIHRLHHPRLVDWSDMGTNRLRLRQGWKREIVVDGFNLPVAIQPSGGKGNCSSAGCDGDLRDNCPPELAVKEDGKTVACRSACDVFHTGEYCCTGQFDNPMTCLPTNYSRSFKQVCPAAYSFGYDDPTSILTCSSADYVVAFCATRNQKVCSYHDKQLTCSVVDSSKASTLVSSISQRWQNLILTFLFILKFGILF